MNTSFERVDNARIKLRVKYLKQLITKLYRGEKLTTDQHNYLNKYADIRTQPVKSS